MPPWDKPGVLDGVRRWLQGSDSLKAFCLGADGIRQSPLPGSADRTPGVYYIGQPEAVAAVRTLVRLLWAWAPCTGPGLEDRMAYGIDKAVGLSEGYQQRYHEYCEANDRGWVYIEGTEGTGKTTLAWAFGVAAACFGANVVSLTAEEVKGLSYQEGTGRGGKSEWAAKLEDLYRARIAILDDIGYSIRDELPDWQAERWDEVLRLLHLRQVRAIITSNHAIRDDGRAPLSGQIGRRAVRLIAEQTAPGFAGDRRAFRFEWGTGREDSHA